MCLPSGWTLWTYRRLDSTNAEARRRAEQGATNGTVIWAETQSAGRGRNSRSWVSDRGNLFCSVILRPGCSAQTAGQLSFLTALAAAAAIEEVAPSCRVQVKWPNDLLIERRKCAGILLESSLTATGNVSWVVSGLGINLTSHPQESRTPATDLATEGAPGVEAGPLLGLYLEQLAGLTRRWGSSGFGDIREAWLARAVGLGETVTVARGLELLAGRFETLDGQGNLILQCEDGRREVVSAGDVFFEEESCS